MSEERPTSPSNRGKRDERDRSDKTQVREARESRADEARLSDAWQPSSHLPSPHPRQGIAHRWIRASLLDRTDSKNVSKKFREGWTPVKASDYPEIKALSDIDSRFGDSIEIGGLVLCAIPEERIQKRREYHDDLAQNQMKAVDEGFMRDNDPRMRKFAERESRTKFGSG